MATTPQYTSSTNVRVVKLPATANTARDGTGTLTNVFTAGSNGSRIESIMIQATGTTTAGMLRFFHVNGTSKNLLFEVPVTAVTPSGTALAFALNLYTSTVYKMYFPIFLNSGDSIEVASNNAESFNIIVQGANF